MAEHVCEHENTGAATLRQQLSLGGDFAAVAEVFRLLDDSSRVRIFWLLCHCESCVIELAEMTGMSEAATARTTISSLKAHRSSMEPPPRPTMSTSASRCLFMKRIAWAMSPAAVFPCT